MTFPTNIWIRIRSELGLFSYPVYDYKTMSDMKTFGIWIQSSSPIDTDTKVSTNTIVPINKEA
jgi:hypothetical protein